MEEYTKIVEKIRDSKVAKLLPRKSGPVSPKQMGDKLTVLQKNIKDLDVELVDAGTAYWKDRSDFNKDQVEKLHADAINHLIQKFKGN